MPIPCKRWDAPIKHVLTMKSIAIAPEVVPTLIGRPLTGRPMLIRYPKNAQVIKEVMFL